MMAVVPPEQGTSKSCKESGEGRETSAWLESSASSERRGFDDRKVQALQGEDVSSEESESLT